MKLQNGLKRLSSGQRQRTWLKGRGLAQWACSLATKDDSWGEFEKLFQIMALKLYDLKKKAEQND